MKSTRHQGVSNMKSFIGVFAFVAFAILFAGCAPKGSENKDAGAAESATAAGEQAEAPARPEPKAIPGKQVALLGRVVDIPFEYKQASDRVRDGERRIGLRSSLADHKAVAGQLENALKQAGFQTKTRENKHGWVWITVVADAGQSKAKIAVRPENNKPGTVIVFKIPEA